MQNIKINTNNFKNQPVVIIKFIIIKENLPLKLFIFIQIYIELLYEYLSFNLKELLKKFKLKFNNIKH